MQSRGLASIGTLVLLSVSATLLDMVLDSVSIFLVFLLLRYPLMKVCNWNAQWFGVLLTMKIAIGLFTPPPAVNLMVSCRLASVRMAATFLYVGWPNLSFIAAAVAVLFLPELAMWWLRRLGY